VDAVLEEQVDLSHDARDVNAAEVAHASAFVGGGLEAGELVLGDLPSADGVLFVCVISWKHVDVRVVVVILVADAEARESCTKDGG